MDKVVLAFSGGLDTSVCVKLLEEKLNKSNKKRVEKIKVGY